MQKAKGRSADHATREKMELRRSNKLLIAQKGRKNRARIHAVRCGLDSIQIRKPASLKIRVSVEVWRFATRTTHPRRHRVSVLDVMEYSCTIFRNRHGQCSLTGSGRPRMSIHDLLEKNLKAFPLTILVFGPATGASDPAVAALLGKRVEIRRHLQGLGHTVDFPEDLVTRAAKSPAHNKFFQELILVREYDMVVALIETPGTNTELGMLASRAEFARKSQLFIREEYRDGLAFGACENVGNLGGEFHSFQFPDDITHCRLLTKVEQLVIKLQMAKYLS